MSIHAIRDLLNKQKIVENIVHDQPSERQDIVERLVHSQHMTKLKTVIARHSPDKVGEILEALPLEDARLVWQQIDPEQQDDILWEIPRKLSEQLVGEREPYFRKGQITAYEFANDRMRIVDVSCRSELEQIKPIWVDVLGASKSERNWIAKLYDLELPDPEELTDLEVSARFYVEENNEIHLHSNFLLDRQGDSRSVPVAFIVHTDVLFTVRNDDLPVFRLQRWRARSQPVGPITCHDLLLDLYAADVEYSADVLEDTYTTLRRVGQEVLTQNVSDADASKFLAKIAEEEDVNGRIRSNMLDTQRAVSFLIRGKFLSLPQAEEAKEILRDIESLNSHTAYLFDKINFLMDATVGFINVNQNKRMSQLTVVNVVFMPLNVLAGIGGMSEFSMMTKDVPWPVAYSLVVVFLIVVGVTTYYLVKYLERKKERHKLKVAKAQVWRRFGRSSASSDLRTENAE